MYTYITKTTPKQVQHDDEDDKSDKTDEDNDDTVEGVIACAALDVDDLGSEKKQL